MRHDSKLAINVDPETQNSVSQLWVATHKWSRNCFDCVRALWAVLPTAHPYFIFLKILKYIFIEKRLGIYIAALTVQFNNFYKLFTRHDRKKENLW